MSLENVRAYLQQFNVDSRILEFNKSSATVELAAAALKCDAARIAKTLSFDAKGKTLLVVVAGDCKINNTKYKQTFGTKAKMLSAQEALNRTGHAVGGVCPFAVPADVEIYLDISLKQYKTVYPACGSSNSAIELTPAELEAYTINPKWVDVCEATKP